MGALPAGIRNALAIPANDATRSINDIEHIVILMQENRSFDHYFGTLRGVRGYGDRRAIRLPNGNSVWYQPGPAGAGYVLPFRPSAPDLGLQFLQDLPHDWTTTHNAWNGGRYDQWVGAKGTTTMAYLTRQDIPFHYQLADAFTICDAYHCSGMTQTDPNRYYMWTGWVGNDGKGGGPVIDNTALVTFNIVRSLGVVVITQSRRAPIPGLAPLGHDRSPHAIAHCQYKPGHCTPIEAARLFVIRTRRNPAINAPRAWPRLAPK
jgi:phospholipase C